MITPTITRNEPKSLQRLASAFVLVIVLPYSFPRAITTYAIRLSNSGRTGKANSRATLVARRWYIFTSPDGDFSLEFPSKPTAEEATQVATTLIRTFGLVTANGMRFSINFHDMGGDPLAPESNEWERNMEQLASEADRKGGLRVVQTHRIEKNIVETELWQTVPETGANINYLRRSILRRARVYTLACGWVINGKEVDKSICRRFFSSLRFAKSRRSY